MIQNVTKWVAKERFVLFFTFLFQLVPMQYFPLQAQISNNIDIHKTYLNQHFQSALDSLVMQFDFPGATAAYVLPDGTTEVFASGFADLEEKRKMTNQSCMLAASIGKTFVAATILSLANEGVICPDDFISKWLGNRTWFSHLPNHDKITVRQLLNHSSGLPDHVYQQAFARELSLKWKEQINPFSPEDLIAFILDTPPLFEVGKDWAYTDTGYILLGLIIEEATGEDVLDVICERFLIPFNLSMTNPSNSRSLENLTAGYVVNDNPFGFHVKTTSSDGKLVWHPGFEWTGGGFVSNSKDLARWAWILFEGKAMPYPYLDVLLNAVSIMHETDEVQYGAGVAIYRNGPFGDSYGHKGWITGYCSSMRYYPDHQIAVAFQINTDIGIVDVPNQPLHKIDSCLAQVVIQSNRK